MDTSVLSWRVEREPAGVENNELAFCERTLDPPFIYAHREHPNPNNDNSSYYNSVVLFSRVRRNRFISNGEFNTAGCMLCVNAVTGQEWWGLWVLATLTKCGEFQSRDSDPLHKPPQRS